MLQKLNQFNLGWLVGVWEGEGCCGCYNMKYQNRGLYWGKRYILSAEISQKEKKFIDKVKRLIGFGRIEISRYSKGYNKEKPIRMFKWKVNAKGARIFLKYILPFVKSPRRIKQIRNALSLDRRFVRAWN